jgi:hypothetical protein
MLQNLKTSDRYHVNWLRVLLITLNFLIFELSAQSFNQDKAILTNYLKRVYASAPFEGAKKVETSDQVFNTVAVTSLATVTLPELIKAAQQLAEVGFAEPCIKFEMLFSLKDSSAHKATSFFLCETLGDFMLNMLRNKPFDGARIVSAPLNKYIVSSITLDNSKYASPEMRDKAGHMKAKQFVNVLVNGSTITSESIIRTDETDKATEITNTEIVKEQAMGFINGLELLTTKEIIPNKTTYLYFSKLTK